LIKKCSCLLHLLQQAVSRLNLAPGQLGLPWLRTLLLLAQLSETLSSLYFPPMAPATALSLLNRSRRRFLSALPKPRSNFADPTLILSKPCQSFLNPVCMLRINLGVEQHDRDPAQV
jgi:hypothetical protein